MTRIRWIAGLMAGACLSGLVACTEESEPTPSPSASQSGSTGAVSTPPTTEAPTTPETTPAASDEEQAAQAAEAHIRGYVAFRDQLLADPTSAVITQQRLGIYLQDPELGAQVTYLTGFRDQGFTTNGGATTFDSIDVTDVKLYPAKKDAAVSIRACYNYDDVTTLDAEGQDAAPNQISPGLATYEVYNYDYPSPDGWRIAVEDILGQECQ